MKSSELKAILEATDVAALPEVIKTYRGEETKTIQNLLDKYQKVYDKYEAELLRLKLMRSYEDKYPEEFYIGGVDEAGRGPYAGPVVAACVILPRDCDILYLNDSKKLSEARREELYDVIMEKAISVGVGIVGNEVIDDVNILQADYIAIREAISKLSVKPDVLLNDALIIPGVEIPQVSIVHGDAKSVSIAAASVIAKVTRDRLMYMYDELYPEYGFAKNKGYGTRDHEQAITEHGICPIHRKSFLSKFGV
ncbi:MAG: ribonuclease HII [Lachnospiraceae bacterium]|nr:ribonuclease HII [Lachnospiraceae bacterium]